MAWQAVALKFLPCSGTLLDLQAASGVLSVAQAVWSAALSISLSSVWQAVLPDCPVTLSLCRDVRTAAMLACQAMSSAWPAGPLNRLVTLSIYPALPLAELSACQAVSSAWRAVLPNCPATWLVYRAVLSVCQMFCWVVSPVLWPALALCQASAPLVSFPVPLLENWLDLQAKPMRALSQANVISVSSISSAMVSFGTGARRLV